MSCKVVASTCTPNQLSACETSFQTKTVRICNAGEVAVYNATSCCRTCRKNETHTGDCSEADFKADTNAQPVCANGETATNVGGACCTSCKRPERNCEPDDVAQCSSVVPLCSGDAKPLIVSGDCCRSCILPPPVCAPVCNASTELCVRRNGTAVCRSIAKIVLRITSELVDRRNKFCNFTEANIRALVTEFVNRFCDNPNNAARCAPYKTAFANVDVAALATSTRATCNTSGLNVTVSVPAVVDTTVGPVSRKDVWNFAQILSTDTALTVMSDAMSSSDATSGFTASAVTVSDTSSSSSSTGSNSGMAVVPSFLAIALLSCMALLQ